jgi:ferredoxin
MIVYGKQRITRNEYWIGIKYTSGRKPERKEDMNVSVDRDLCIGCGMCVSICPQVFEMDDKEIAIVRANPAEMTDTLQEAVDSCPTSAISIE